MNPKTLIVISTLIALSASGCYAGVEARGPVATYDVVAVPPPVRVETYPYVVYDGAPYYYVEGRWYRHSGSGWVYYRNEPPYLARRRPNAPPAVRVAPPARPGVYTAPPARGPGGPVIAAPPAHRR
jgi:hypothetical protein